MSDFDKIQSLLQERADCNARINLIPYDGSPEIKENASGKYLYIRKRIGSRLTSTYVDVYSDELYQLLLRNAKELKELRKKIRHIDKKLADLGYNSSQLDKRVLQNLDFARANMKANIYDQAVLEGVATSFPQTEDIIDNGTVNGMTANDIQKILNLKHAWEFILDNDVIQAKSDILSSEELPIDIAIKLCMYSMKTQVFIDGNKRASVIFANHYLIAHGQGFLVIPEEHVSEFKKKLVAFYEGEDINIISNFLKEKCWKTF